jgi:hypothetical protein
VSDTPLNRYDEKTPEGLAWARGYVQCLRDYGIWNSGVQTIGCLEKPIKPIIKAIAEDVNVQESEI